MKKILAIALIGIMCAGCSDADTARRALDNMGFTEIETFGYSFWAGCSKDDTFVTKFRAKNVNGKMVTGVVCNGWLKGATVRFD